MTNENAIRVVVVAPAMLAWGLEQMLHSERPRLEHVGSAGSLAQAEQLLHEYRPDVTILDLDGGYGSDAILDVKGWSSSALVALTSSDDRSMLDRMVVAGVRGIVRKSDPPAALVKAIEKVHVGELWIDRCATSRIFLELARQHTARDSDPEQLKIATLTTRERQTIQAVASDSAAPGKVIARRMCISEHTLRNHLSAIYAKLGLANRLDLYVYATRHNLHNR